MSAIAAASRRSLIDLASGGITSLCTSLGMTSRVDEILADMRFVLGAHSDREIAGGPWFHSDVCDDHTPFEFSISVDRRGAELRVLMETAGDQPTLFRMQQAASDATVRLASRLRLPTARLDLVAHLFTAPEPAGLFSRWHALEYGNGRAPRVKIYLNPQIRGIEHARACVDEALCLLGREDAREELDHRVRRGAADEIKYFALDLDHGPTARVKVYTRHHNLQGNELETFLADARDYSLGRASTFCREMLGEGPHAGKPVFSCLAWVDDHHEPKPTVYAPIVGYVASDAEAWARIAGYMRSVGLDPDPLERTLVAFVGRPLGASRGVISYVSARWDAGAPRMTLYLSPLAYAGARHAP
jgi:DMATS type aromatic prenyltransferase